MLLGNREADWSIDRDAGEGAREGASVPPTFS